MAMTTPTSYNWLKDYLGDTKLSAQEVADALGAHAFEIEDVRVLEDDTVIDVDILPNRSSDCLCHRGIARELASITGVPLAHDPLLVIPTLATTDTIAVDIQNETACPRFTAALITDITVQDSPAWLQQRLKAIGQRPINNIVDATNYVMYAIGQPLHAYDADLFARVENTWNFVVRDARAGETVSLLAEGGKDEDRVVTCKGTELLIVDGSTDTPIGLAGVKGGRYAGVHSGTKNIIIEAAHFHPTTTRKTARRLGIVIDASKRFENEPSRELPLYAQSEIIKLITDIAQGTFVGMIDTYTHTKPNPKVRVSPKRVNALLGLELASDTMQDVLDRIGAVVHPDGEDFMVTGPFERTDLNLEEDFIEEIGRLYGYDHITSVVPEPVLLIEYNKRHYYSEIVRATLLALGFNEVITSSFRNKDKVQLLNALASDKSCLRSRLHMNISEALDRNAAFTDLLGTTDTRVFEIGTVFYEGTGDIHEHVSLAFGVRLKQSGYSGKEDKIIAAARAALEEALDVTLDCTVEKGVAEVNLTALLDTLPAPTAYDPVTVDQETVYKPFSHFPSISRDIAMWVSDAPGERLVKEQVVAVLDTAAGELRVRTTFVDEFVKDGRTSLAFRLVFQSKKKTLTDEEVNAQMVEVYEAVEEYGWETR